MKIFRIKKITHKNIDRLIKENLYRGFSDGSTINVQCMNKNQNITFDFKNEIATIEEGQHYKQIEICDMAPKRLYDKIYKSTC